MMGSNVRELVQPEGDAASWYDVGSFQPASFVMGPALSLYVVKIRDPCQRK